MAAAMAVDEPEIAPNKTAASKVAYANPPGTHPTTESANLKRPATSPVFSIKNPAKIKNGIATNVYFVRKLKKASNSVLYVKKSSNKTRSAVAPARAIPIGAPANKRVNKDPPRAHIINFLL
jgi:hypothetical protein